MAHKMAKKAFMISEDTDVFIDMCTDLNDTPAWNTAGSRDASKCLDTDPETLYELLCGQQV